MFLKIPQKVKKQERWLIYTSQNPWQGCLTTDLLFI